MDFRDINDGQVMRVQDLFYSMEGRKLGGMAPKEKHKD